MVGHNGVVCQASSPCPWEGCLVPVGGMQVVEPDQGIKIAGVVPEMAMRVRTLYARDNSTSMGLDLEEVSRTGSSSQGQE